MVVLRSFLHMKCSSGQDISWLTLQGMRKSYRDLVEIQLYSAIHPVSMMRFGEYWVGEKERLNGWM